MAVALGLSAQTVAIKDDPAARRFGAAKLEARVTNTSGLNDQFNLDILDLPPGWFTRTSSQFATSSKPKAAPTW